MKEIKLFLNYKKKEGIDNAIFKLSKKKITKEKQSLFIGLIMQYVKFLEDRYIEIDNIFHSNRSVKVIDYNLYDFSNMLVSYERKDSLFFLWRQYVKNGLFLQCMINNFKEIFDELRNISWDILIFSEKKNCWQNNSKEIKKRIIGLRNILSKIKNVVNKKEKEFALVKEEIEYFEKITKKILDKEHIYDILKKYIGFIESRFLKKKKYIDSLECYQEVIDKNLNEFYDKFESYENNMGRFLIMRKIKKLGFSKGYDKKINEIFFCFQEVMHSIIYTRIEWMWEEEIESLFASIEDVKGEIEKIKIE